VQKLIGDVTGTVNVDNGRASIHESVRMLTYVGQTNGSPCPVCGGTCTNDSERTCLSNADCDPGGSCTRDAVAGDGVAQGACTTGKNRGEPRDGNRGANTTIDCLPDAGAIFGAAKPLAIQLSTAHTELAAGLSCGGTNGGLSCPCLLCSADPTVPCHSDADCAGQPASCSESPLTACTVDGDCLGVDAGACNSQKVCQRAQLVSCNKDSDCDSVNVGVCHASTCTVDGGAGFPLPNDCDDGLCSSAGGANGICTNGPDDSFCDGFTKPDGSGIYPCDVNDDCAANLAGSCTLVQRRRCFLDPIEALGSSDSRTPVLAAAFCMAPTSQPGVNASIGLPGPARIVRETELRSFCSATLAKIYRPGSGGCD
jgi:hypothetical protein